MTVTGKIDVQAADHHARMTPYSSTPEQQRRLGFRTVLIGAAVAITYVAAAEIGFRAAFVAEQVTTVWAPTGIAIASLLIWGPRLWPAIWLGAFAVNAPRTRRCGQPSWWQPATRWRRFSRPAGFAASHTSISASAGSRTF